MVSDEAIDRFPDFKEFLRKLEECEGWNESDDIFISRAPGRLDVMGIAIDILFLSSFY